MRTSLKYFLLPAAFGLFLLAACEKYQDPPPADPDPRLTNPYCNDPRAVNYNQGFPGMPDSSICVYPVDYFQGSWNITDSVFREDHTFDTIETRTLSFVSTEDSSLTHMTVQGWCNGPLLYATANKYRRADLDTMSGIVDGQLLCTGTDTISGYFFLNDNANDTLRFQFKINGVSGIHFHSGWGMRQ